MRGVYTQENFAIAPIFKQWIAPLADLGVSTISYRNTGGTDHLSFDAVGLPGFQFIQDPMDYETRTHHSDMDTSTGCMRPTWSRPRWSRRSSSTTPRSAKR